MFGYVKPYVPDLRVRENEMYRALYCGLCRSMGKCTGCLSRFTLSYDFVFLAALRTALCKDEIKVRAHRCFVHPLKKRPAVESSDALKYSAACSAVLCRAKLADDVRDTARSAAAVGEDPYPCGGTHGKAGAAPRRRARRGLFVA